MHPRRYAMIGGIVMLALGLLALIPSLSQVTSELPPLKLETGYGLFLGIFAFNIVNKLVLIVFGIAGILSARSETRSLPASINWCRSVFFVMGAGAILGMIPSTNTFFGYWPLFGREIWAHAAFALIGAYFGYYFTSKVPKVDLDRLPTSGHMRGV